MDVAEATKKCFKCGETKPLADFYKHKRMADGHLNKCKKRTKRDVNERYYREPEKIRAYEQARLQDPERKANALVYQKNRRKRYPEKNRARQEVNNAIRDGKLKKLPCEVCGTTEKVEAHHHDYSLPLDVKWLCFKHHRELEHGQQVFTKNPTSPD